MGTIVILLFVVASISEATAGMSATYKNSIKAQLRNLIYPFKQNQSTIPIRDHSQLPDDFQGTTELPGSDVNDKDNFRVPYLVSIQMLTNSRYEHICAGTIIDIRFVLTTAHCFHSSKNPKRMSIMVGSNELSLTMGLRYNVSQIIVHDFYEPLLGWDIALLKIHSEFVFDGRKVDKVNLNGTVVVPDGMDAYLIGWGKTNMKTNHKMDIVSFKTINSKKCRKRGFIHITKTEVCAISYKGRGACDGDSGGPLVSSDLSTQLGILSYGRELCMRGRIYAFTYIHPLVDWIFNKINKYG